MKYGRVFLLMVLLCSPAWANDTDSPAKPSQDVPASQVSDKSQPFQVAMDNPIVLLLALAAMIALMPPVYGLAILALSLVPILWGWRLARASWAFGYALMFGFYASMATIGSLGIYGGMAVGAIAGVLGGIAGLYMQKFCAGLFGAIVIAAVAAIPGSMLESDILMYGLAVPGFVVGLWLGWKVAFYMDAVQTSITGAIAATVGALTLVPDKENVVHLLGVGVSTFVAGCVLGLVVQFRAINREKEEGKLAT